MGNQNSKEKNQIALQLISQPCNNDLPENLIFYKKNKYLKNLYFYFKPKNKIKIDYLKDKNLSISFNNNNHKNTGIINKENIPICTNIQNYNLMSGNNNKYYEKQIIFDDLEYQIFIRLSSTLELDNIMIKINYELLN
jgi:hypothetical protein